MRLYELSEKSIVIMYSYSNPPTKEYREYYNDLLQRSRNTKHCVYLNTMVDAEANPLSFVDNLNFNKKVFPDVNFSDKKYNSFDEILKHLSQEYTNIVVLVKKEDREKYRSYELESSRDGLLNLQIEIIKSRNDYNSIARESVIENDYSKFVETIPTNSKSIQSKLFITLRKAMLVGNSVKESVVEVKEKHPLINELIRKTTGVDVIESLLITDKIGNKVYKSLSNNINVVEVKNLKECRYGFDKLNNTPCLFVPDISSNYLLKNINTIQSLLENTVASNVATTANIIGEPIRRIDSISSIIGKVDKNSTDKLSDAMRLFINEYGYINSDIIKKIKEAIK